MHRRHKRRHKRRRRPKRHVPPLPADSFIFEAPSAGASFSLTALQRTTALAALLLLALVLFLRVTVSQTRARTMTPVLYGGFAVVIVLGVWLLADTLQAPLPQPVSTSGQRR